MQARLAVYGLIPRDKWVVGAAVTTNFRVILVAEKRKIRLQEKKDFAAKNPWGRNH